MSPRVSLSWCQGSHDVDCEAKTVSPNLKSRYFALRTFRSVVMRHRKEDIEAFAARL